MHLRPVRRGDRSGCPGGGGVDRAGRRPGGRARLRAEAMAAELAQHAHQRRGWSRAGAASLGTRGAERWATRWGVSPGPWVTSVARRDGRLTDRAGAVGSGGRPPAGAQRPGPGRGRGLGHDGRRARRESHAGARDVHAEADRARAGRGGDRPRRAGGRQHKAVAAALGRRPGDSRWWCSIGRATRSSSPRSGAAGRGSGSSATATCRPGVAVATGDAGVDMCIGIGGSTEGILTAAALRCLGGEMQARFWPVSRHQVELVKAAGIEDIEARLTTQRHGGRGVLFAATAVTAGRFLKAVDVRPMASARETLVLCSRCQRSLKIQTIHRSEQRGAPGAPGAQMTGGTS